MSETDIQKKLSEIEDRKRALKEELNRLEDDLGTSFTGIKDDVTGRVDPRWWIRRYPLQITTAALLLGFFAGNKDTTKAGTMVGAIFGALKGYAAKKIVDTVVEVIEKK